MMKLSSHLSQSLPPLFYSIRVILNTSIFIAVHILSTRLKTLIIRKRHKRRKMI